MKDRIQDILKSFFVSTVLINVAMFVCGSIFRPDQRFGYEAFLYPLIYGFLATIPAFFMYSKKELTLKQTLIREFIQMCLIIVLIITFMFGRFKNIQDLVPQIIGVSVSIVIIYVLVHFFGWLMDLKTAKVMTEDLKRFQQKASGGSE